MNNRYKQADLEYLYFQKSLNLINKFKYYQIKRDLTSTSAKAFLRDWRSSEIKNVKTFINQEQSDRQAK